MTQDRNLLPSSSEPYEHERGTGVIELIKRLENTEVELRAFKHSTWKLEKELKQLHLELKVARRERDEARLKAAELEAKITELTRKADHLSQLLTQTLGPRKRRRVENCLLVLEALKKLHGVAAEAQLVRETGWQRNRVRRTLRWLADAGLVLKRGRGLYQTTLESEDYAQSILRIIALKKRSS